MRGKQREMIGLCIAFISGFAVGVVAMVFGLAFCKAAYNREADAPEEK